MLAAPGCIACVHCLLQREGDYEGMCTRVSSTGEVYYRKVVIEAVSKEEFIWRTDMRESSV